MGKVFAEACSYRFSALAVVRFIAVITVYLIFSGFSGILSTEFLNYSNYKKLKFSFAIFISRSRNLFILNFNFFFLIFISPKFKDTYYLQQYFFVSLTFYQNQKVQTTNLVLPTTSLVIRSISESMGILSENIKLQHFVPIPITGIFKSDSCSLFPISNLNVMEKNPILCI